MKIREVMTGEVVKIHPEETAAVAARTLTHYNIGALPVCDHGGNLCGLVTDRDLVTRCLARESDPEHTRVKDVMSPNVVSAGPDMEVCAAASIMSRQKIRRLPVVENGKLCGMLSLGDLAKRENTNPDAAEALGSICTNITRF